MTRFEDGGSVSLGGAVFSSIEGGGSRRTPGAQRKRISTESATGSIAVGSLALMSGSRRQVSEAQQRAKNESHSKSSLGHGSHGSSHGSHNQHAQRMPGGDAALGGVIRSLVDPSGRPSGSKTNKLSVGRNSSEKASSGIAGVVGSVPGEGVVTASGSVPTGGAVSRSSTLLSHGVSSDSKTLAGFQSCSPVVGGVPVGARSSGLSVGARSSELAVGARSSDGKSPNGGARSSLDAEKSGSQAVRRWKSGAKMVMVGNRMSDLNKELSADGQRTKLFRQVLHTTKAGYRKQKMEFGDESDDSAEREQKRQKRRDARLGPLFSTVRTGFSSRRTFTAVLCSRGAGGKTVSSSSADGAEEGSPKSARSAQNRPSSGKQALSVGAARSSEIGIRRSVSAGEAVAQEARRKGTVFTHNFSRVD